MDADLKAQLDELNAGIADLVEATGSADVSALLAQMMEVLNETKTAEPKVTVNVSPTPIQNTVNLPQGDWNVSFKYDNFGRISAARMSRIKS